MKKIAVVASGWHFPLHFFTKIAEQKIPAGWKAEFFCVSHRDPAFAVEEKKKEILSLGYDRRGLYDRIMYDKIATVDDLRTLGWEYSLEPNMIGDWGNSNQWLEKHDYREYDLFLFTHDDNFILNNELFVDLCESGNWLILANSKGVPPGSIRGSFEFFTREMMDMIGGKFDLSMTTFTREGKTTTNDPYGEIGKWNATVTPLSNLIAAKKLQSRVVSLSPYYRISAYCLEGERGYIHRTYELNTLNEEKGLDLIEKIYYDGKLHPLCKGIVDLSNVKLSEHKMSRFFKRMIMKAGAVKGRIIKIFHSQY